MSQILIEMSCENDRRGFGKVKGHTFQAIAISVQFSIGQGFEDMIGIHQVSYFPNTHGTHTDRDRAGHFGGATVCGTAQRPAALTFGCCRALFDRSVYCSSRALRTGMQHVMILRRILGSSARRFVAPGAACTAAAQV